ncbi:MAG: hypothetical protein HRT37_13485 [Alteromonadaceae bacterium]|nr:hypothetical protein [Alteromonadaceae bacterium]
MIKKKAREKNSIYHDSYYRHRRKPSSIKWILLLLFIVICALGAKKLMAQSQHTTPINFDPQGSGELLFKHSTGNDFSSAMMLQSRLIAINGMIATPH